MLCSVYKVSDVKFNPVYDDQYFFKEYEAYEQVMPLSLMMRVRARDHYLDVDTRVLSPDDEILPGSSLLVCKVNAYGLLGTCSSKDRRTGNIKINFDKEREAARVHDPFMGQKAIEQFQNANREAANKARQYFGE